MNEQQPVLIIYHAHCPDGFTAAWVCHRAHGGVVEFFPASYGDTPPDVTDRNVEIVDFSYGREDLVRMHEQARSLIVLDHHKSAQANCEGLSFCVFDMEQSGAGLAWDHHYSNKQGRPKLVRYIEDRDIWRWALPFSKEISAFISTFSKTLDDWDWLADQLDTEEGFDLSVGAGMAVLRYQMQMVERIASGAGRKKIAQYNVPVVNSPILQSELGQHLSEGESFAAVWYTNERTGETVWSLRSKPDGVDVSHIAKAFGGGGHKHAAGFTCMTSPLPEVAVCDGCGRDLGWAAPTDDRIGCEDCIEVGYTG